MTANELIDEARKLSLHQRWRVVQEIAETLDVDVECYELSDELKAELQRRLDAKNGTEPITMDQVFSELGNAV